MPTPGPNARELELLRRMARIACIGSWEYDPVARELYWTEQVYRIVELEPYSVTPTLDAAVGYYAPEARATIARALQSALERGEAWDLELPLVTARGRRIWVRVIGEPEMADGRCVRLAGTVEDVTAARRAREALKARSAENRRLALVAENTSNLVLITGADDRIQWVNASFTRVTGYAPAEAIGHAPCDLLCRGDGAADPRLTAAREAMRRREAIRGLQVELTRKDGSRYWAEIEIRPVFDERGATVNYIHIQNDVTAKRVAEQQALAATEALELAISATGIGFFYRDLDQAEPVWDAQVYRIYGLAPGEPVPPTDVRHAMVLAEDRPAFLAAREALQASGAPMEIEYRIRRRDGAVRWIRSRRAVVHVGAQRAPRIVGALLDITEIKEAEETQRLLTERLELASRTAGIGVWELDLESRRVVWNEEMFRLYGLSAERTPPDTADWIQRWVHADDRERVAAKVAEFMHRGGSYQDEHRVVLPDGTERWIDARAFLYRPDPDRPGRVIGVNFDITERKLAERRTAAYAEQLRAALARLELATGGSDIGIFERALDKGPGFWSAQMFRLYGEPPQAAAPDWDWLLARIDPEDHALFEAQWERIKQSSAYVDTEFRIRRADGSRAWLLTRARLEPGDGARPPRVVGIGIDITRRKEAEIRAAQYADWLRLTTRTIGIGLWYRDLDTGRAVWDAQTRRMFGLAEDGPTPSRDEYLAFVLPEDRARAADAISSVPPPGATVELEYRIRRVDGAVRTILSRRAAQYGPDGRPLRVIGAAIDVTESRQAQARAAESAQLLQLATQAVGVGFSFRDLATGAGHWDGQARAVFGFPLEGPAPTIDEFLARVDERDRARVVSPYVNPPPAGAHDEVEYDIHLPDGRTRRVLSRRAAQYDADGRALRLYAAVIDVTASREAEAHLRDARERLQLAAEAGGIASWERNLETGEARWDEAMFDFYGLPRAPVAPPLDVVLSLVHPEDRAIFADAWKHMANSTGAVEWECRIVRRDGSVVHLASRGRAERRADGTPWRVIGVALDVTASRAAQRRLQEINERMQLAAAATGIGFWRMGLDGASLDADRQLKLMYGFDPDGPVPTSDEFFAAVLPEDRAIVLAARARALASDEPIEVEYRIDHPHKGIRHILSRRALRRDAAGQPLHVVGASLDVTDARRAQSALRSAHERLELATRTAGIGIWESSLDAERMTWDARMYELYGQPPDWVPTHAAWLARVHPDDRARVAQRLDRDSAHAEGGECEYRIVRPDGEERVIAERFVFCRDADGRAVHVLGTNIDITEIRRAQRERDELSDRLRLAAASVGMGVWVWDLATRASVWDDAMYALFGATRESFRDRIWLDAVHPDDRSRAARAVQDACDGVAPLDTEFRIVWPDGTVRHLASRGKVERDAGGTVVRMVGVNWDVTERRAAEQRALELAERLKLATQAAGLAAWHIDGRTRRMDADELLCRMHGVPPGPYEDLWQVLEATIAPEDLPALKQASIDARLEDKPFEAEYRTIHPDGSIRHLAVRGVYQRDEAREPVRMLGVTWDVTERRTAEAALLAKEAAERASRAKTEFLSRMSHELRTPLNAIIGFTQVLALDRTHPLAPAQRDRVDKIQQAGWHLLNLINEILDLSRIEAGALPLSMAVVPLGEVVDECIALVAADAQRRRLDIGQTQTARAPADVWADRTRLKQVLLNLLSNAVKYNREGGRIDVDLDADAEGRALITVRDTGPGLAPAQIEKLFQPFNRLGMESTPIEGTGIGLTIALRLVEQMGGRLTVTSEPGAGSAFHVALQAASAARDETADVLQSIAPAGVEPREDVRGTVLYVEDNPSNVAVVEQLLALRPNVKLFTAGDGASGRVMAAVCQPDLILLDMRLPDTDGASLLAELRARPETKSIPCIGLSANAMPEDIARARASGFADYWTKPIEAGPFLRGIDAALARAR